MIDPNTYRMLMVRPVLQHIDRWSEDAEELVMLTAATESHFVYVEQLGGGPAVGLLQMEPNTHDDIWGNYLKYRHELADRVRQLCVEPVADEMVYNHLYAAAMARVHYLRVPAPLPPAGDVDAMASYWKQHYNTALGAGTVEKAVEDYHRLVA